MASSTGFTAAIMITIAVMFAGDSSGREIRPSDHGLGFQAPPPGNSSMEMRSFFNSNRSSSSSSSSSSDVSPRNVTESLPPALWRATGGGGGGGRVGKALMMASLVCGITGGILLVASALLYLFNKHRRRNPKPNESFRADSDNDISNANKLELVVRNP